MVTEEHKLEITDQAAKYETSTPFGKMTVDVEKVENDQLKFTVKTLMGTKVIMRDRLELTTQLEEALSWLRK